ncbi:heat-inducible transcription repressor HrcA [Granulicatella sp. zg-ZJ]|uniref:heat-inducible transcriptional repressor HrcA n=1 Tax=unclassified Granulicatella TaxID=2630493 RepID=UPI0013BF4798|nr:MULTISPECIES: heat-inducible transcriptional repressor HrcA [unclassified Granulicatella]MBS4750127.1 heat-inducible transcription repressor HrcA [Carnobacteriaceae bacterium zg-ZUI78]NEW62120.1 heat-inducible transcription repressor HrcA [Granulicatella sp. zg-ZJ]NEW66837.1 heat-inducible transcription repressor HrcA [Granulicatella sp. zg-84]QMI86223.1 heat-inducible transcription repressor HrcA [Carnobacteriaceae bacterium zg-84]
MLTERQLKILQLIIRLYAEQQEPVGSKTLLKEADLPFSSATIRNEMMKLEELGFLEKTHSSSGRIPSVLGYRFYVDNMLPAVQTANIQPQELTDIRQTLRHRYHEISEIVDISAKMLSNLTNYTTIVLGPETRQSKLTGFRLVPLSDTQVMAILVTDKGMVENRIFNIPASIIHDDLEKIVRILNDELVGLYLSEVYDKLQYDIPQLIRQNISEQFDILPILQELMTKMETDRMFIAGKTNLFDYIDYENSRTNLKNLYNMIENSSDLYQLMSPTHQGVDIKFGSELNHEAFKDLSFVTTTYETNNGKGVIALIGPTNMSYARVVGLMNALSEELSGSINQYFDDLDI